MLYGTERVSCTIDVDRDTEFSGDDADQYSELVDLGMLFEKVIIEVPTITSATITVYAQEGGDVLTVPKAVHYRQTSDNATAAWATTASTGSYFITCDALGGVQYIRLKSSENQEADRTFYVRGARS
jgi:hypothetical protein